MGKKKAASRKKPVPKVLPKCGVAMPIAATENCSANHWQEVKDIFVDALKTKFFVDLVSDEPEVDVIHSKIVTNLAENPIVIVDASELNPNVMFELGLRLAFDMPTILVKDDKTEWKFDISPIETLIYPRDLRHSKILAFKKLLKDKAVATLAKREELGEKYSPFLRYFKKLERKTIDTEQVGDTELILSKLEDLKARIEAPIKKGPATKAEIQRKRSVAAYESALARSYLERAITELWALSEDHNAPPVSISRIENAVVPHFPPDMPAVQRNRILEFLANGEFDEASTLSQI